MLPAFTYNKSKYNFHTFLKFYLLENYFRALHIVFTVVFMNIHLACDHLQYIYGLSQIFNKNFEFYSFNKLNYELCYITYYVIFM